MTTPEVITSLADNEIFVFGSNQAGRHGKGAALVAYKRFGAKWNQGDGIMGSSYGIPTKDFDIVTLDLPVIGWYVRKFLNFARSRPDLTFLVTPIGCGLAGYQPKQIAPMFTGASPNVVLPACFST